MLERWNLAEAERILEFCGEHGFVFSAQSAQANGKYPHSAFLRDSRYRAFLERLIELRERNAVPVNGTPKLLRTLLLFEEFKCFPTMFPRIDPNGDIFYPCEVLRKIAGNVLEDGSISAAFERGRKLYGEVPECKNTCFLIGDCPVLVLRRGLPGSSGGHGPLPQLAVVRPAVRPRNRASAGRSPRRTAAST